MTDYYLVPPVDQATLHQFVKELYNEIKNAHPEDVGHWQRLRNLAASCSTKLQVALSFPPAEQQLFTSRSGVKNNTVSEDGNLFYKTQDHKQPFRTDLSDPEKALIRAIRSDALVIYTTSPCRVGDGKQGETTLKDIVFGPFQPAVVDPTDASKNISAVPEVKLTSAQLSGQHSEILYILEASKGRAVPLLNKLFSSFTDSIIIAEVAPYWQDYFKAANFFPAEPVTAITKSTLRYFVAYTLFEKFKTVTTAPSNADPLQFDQDNTGNANSAPVVAETATAALSKLVELLKFAEKSNDSYTGADARQSFDADVNTILSFENKVQGAKVTEIKVMENLQKLYSEMFTFTRTNVTQQNTASIGAVERVLSNIGVPIVNSFASTAKEYAQHVTAPDTETLRAMRAYLVASGSSNEAILSHFINAENKWRGSYTTPELRTESEAWLWKSAMHASNFKDITLSRFEDARNLHLRLVELRGSWRAELASANSQRATDTTQDKVIQTLRSTASEFEAAFRAKIDLLKKKPSITSQEREQMSEWIVESVQIDNNPSLWPLVIHTSSSSAANTASSSGSLAAALAAAQQPSIALPNQAEVTKIMGQFSEAKTKFEEKEKEASDKLKAEIAQSYANAETKHKAIVEITKELQSIGEADRYRGTVQQARECFHAAMGVTVESQNAGRTSTELGTVRDILVLNNNCLDRYLTVFQKEQKKALERFRSSQQMNTEQKLVAMRMLLQGANDAIAEARKFVSKPEFYNPAEKYTLMIKDMEQKRDAINILISQVSANTSGTPQDILNDANTKEAEEKTLLKNIVETMLLITSASQDDIPSILLMEQLRVSQTQLNFAQNAANQSNALAEAHQRAVQLAQKAQEELLHRSQFHASSHRTVGVSRSKLDEAENAVLDNKRLDLKLLIEQLDRSIKQKNAYKDLPILLANLTQFENDVKHLTARTDRMNDLLEESQGIKARAYQLLQEQQHQAHVQTTLPPAVENNDDDENDEEEEEEEDESDESDGEMYENYRKTRVGDVVDAEDVDWEDVLSDALFALRDAVKRRDLSSLETLIDDVEEAESEIGSESPEVSRWLSKARALLK